MAVASKLQAFLEPPGRAENQFVLVHFWAPMFKWGLSIANAAGFTKPPDQISYPQQFVAACSGLIWSRYSAVIVPRNLNLVGVNLTMAATGVYQLTRKFRHDHFSEAETVADQE